MATEGESKKTWIDVQKKTFTGWANNYLKERILKIGDLGSDLEDGVLLINLLEIISSKKLPKYNAKPKIRMQKIENNNFALAFIKSEGLKLVSIGAEDIVDCQLKLILGLIWTLILRYQIQMSEGDSPKAALLEWVRKQVAPYNVKVNNFTDSWTDGKVLSALTDSLKPGVIDMNKLSNDAFTDVDHAMDVALAEYEIPKIMDPSDMVNLPDELSVITYVSYFRDYQMNKENRDRAAAEALERKRRTTSDPSKVIAFGPGLENRHLSKKGDFTIQAINYYGDALPTGGENFKVKVVGADGSEVPVTLVDQNNGKYDGSYTATVPQEYTVTITLDDQDIKDSPFQVKVNGADKDESNAYGPGLEGGQVGVTAPFKIQARNKEGEPLTEGKDDFTVKVTNPDGTTHDVPVKDNGDGSYDVELKPTTGGDHQVEVFLRGEPIAQGPSVVKVLNSDSNNSYCDGPGFEGANARRPTTFTIHSVDADGKPCTKGNDPYSVSIVGANPVEVSIVDNDDGTYQVNYTPEKPGDYEINVTLNDKPIKDIPKSIRIKPTADADKSYAEGPGLEAGECFQKSKFRIHAVDNEGNPVNEGGDGFSITVEGPSQVDPVLVDNGDGTYDVDFEPKLPGDYTINLTLDGDVVNGFPKTVTVKPAPSADNSFCKGKGLEKLFDNELAEFDIFAIDTDGNKRTDGGDPFDVKITVEGSDVEVKVEDKNDGTYHVIYEPLITGEYTVLVTLRGQPLKNMPVKVNCIEGADGEQSSFGSFTFTVAAKNKKGEPKTCGGDLFETSITGPAEYVKLDAIDNCDGTYTAAYTLVGNGRFSTAVKLNGKHIEGSPFKQVLGNPGKKNPDVKTFTTSAVANGN
eukprot:gene7890-9709_t